MVLVYNYKSFTLYGGNKDFLLYSTGIYMCTIAIDYIPPDIYIIYVHACVHSLHNVA